MSIIDTVSNLIWLRIDYGFTIFDWENGENYFPYLGYIAVFSFSFWLIFGRGPLERDIKV
ncbi:hypothetical protein [Acinetobacter guillouiae]|uniref:hypothetical protein n=1 Tax=Acinetobacter guillouiae TaxID=106649 RepID=UPI00124FA146|nr:hypothetical protein [Acinetobacter guillouiae]